MSWRSVLRSLRSPKIRAFRAWLALASLLFVCAPMVNAQTRGGGPTLPAMRTDVSTLALQQQLEQVRAELQQTRALQQRVQQLEDQLSSRPAAAQPRASSGPVVPAMSPPNGWQPAPRNMPQGVTAQPSVLQTQGTFVAQPDAGAAQSQQTFAPQPWSSQSPTSQPVQPTQWNSQPQTYSTAPPGWNQPIAEEPDPDKSMIPFFVKYGYNFGGGYTQFGDENEEFTVKLQNQLTLDGTFYDHRNMPTAEKGFNIPFYRTYLYGNITKEWDYQFAVQGFLGEFNVLDAWVNYSFGDELNFRVGRMLSPFLYEYWAFSPAWEPVITNSLLFQLAGKRQIGGMAWGRLLENRTQYQIGIFNGIEGGFFDLDRSVDLLASISVTPWKGEDDLLDSLGFGVSTQTGMQNYNLNEGNTEAFINGAGEPTLNFNYINSTGVPFFQYNDDVRADGMRTKFSPHIFWYGRLSVQAEYLWQQRALADSTTKGTTTQQGWQATTAWLVTGESRKGDGLGGWQTVEPDAPFSPSRGDWGPGAWELAFQYSQLDLGSDDFRLGFADPATSTNRIDQLMLGVNWWPNKYTRLSFDWVNARLNRPVPTPDQMLDQYNIFWTRAAMFF